MWGRWRGGSWPQPSLGEAGKRARPFSKMRGHFLEFREISPPRRNASFSNRGVWGGGRSVSLRCGRGAQRPPTVNSYRYAPGLSSAAGTPGIRRVQPVAEGSARRAPCARSPAHPRQARRRTACGRVGTSARKRGLVVRCGLGFFNNHKAFEVDREILSEKNETVDDERPGEIRGSPGRGLEWS